MVRKKTLLIIVRKKNRTKYNNELKMNEEIFTRHGH